MSETQAATTSQASGVGRFIWFELSTTDSAAARAFYGAAIGWETEAFDSPPTYYIWKASGTGVGGVMQEAGVPPHWRAYVYVDDVDGTIARALQLGGKLIVPAMDIPEVGRFGIIADPQGASIAVMKPIGEDRPPELRKVGHVGWHELNTTDSKSAFQFYSTLLGWVHGTDMDMGEMGTYTIFRHPADAEDAWLGGMSDMAQHMNYPPHWLYYVNVDGMDAALERIKAGGGKVVNGPMDVPGGRAAQCLDPQGAGFAIFAEEAS